jgi:chemotaxis protein MotB
MNSVKTGEGALTFSAGFIRQTVPQDGEVARLTGDTQSGGNRVLLGTGDVAFLKLAKPEAVSPDDLFTIYRRVHEVWHPTQGRYLGDLFTILGIVRVIKITQGLATVQIVRSYGSINPGDSAMVFVPPPSPGPAPAERRLPETPGVIVDLQPRRSLIAQAQVVYIDWGRKDGLQVGDRLEVLRVVGSLPMRTNGELKVLAVEDVTATALIVRSTAFFTRGDRFLYKYKEPPQSEAPQQTSARPPQQETASEELDRLIKARMELAPSQPTQATGEASGEPQSADQRLAALASRLDFESGKAPFSEAGLPVLKQISEVLKNVTDKQIRIEGHTDNMPIGPSLKEQYPTNQELSEARANGVRRYLVEEGGVNPENVSAVGQADTKPVAGNDTEEGRKKNRRIEITLLPKKESEPSPQSPEAKPEAGGKTPAAPASEPAGQAEPAVPGPPPAPAAEPAPLPKVAEPEPSTPSSPPPLAP